MSKQKPKIIDLEESEDGTYTAKNSKSNIVVRESSNISKNGKAKYVIENNADQFLNGLDVGLDFLDKVVPRIERFLRLRG